MDDIQQKKPRSLKENILRLLKLNNSPHEIALGVAIGVFIAIIPLYGFHTIMVIIAALLIRRVNKIAILAGTNISLPPTVPFITWIGYTIGNLILGKDYPALHLLDFKNLSPKDYLGLYSPLFVGSIIEGLICAVIFYFFTRWFIVKKRQHRPPSPPYEGRRTRDEGDIRKGGGYE